MVKVIEYGLASQHNLGTDAAVESVKFFQSLLLYAQRAPKTAPDHTDSLRMLAVPVISLLDSEDLFDASQELVSDVMANYESFFRKEHYDLITELLLRPRTQSWMADLLTGNFVQESMAYARLLFFYGEARPEELAHGINSNDQQILYRLVSLTQCAGLAIVEDEIISQALDFWSNFIESSADLCSEAASADRPDWLERLEECTQRVIEALLFKVRMPPVHVFHQWDHDSKLAFQAMRRDFQHLIASTYTLPGFNLFESFVAYTSNAWQERNWEAVEAGLFSISGISIAVSDTDEGDGPLSALFASNLFTDMNNPEFLVPLKTQQTAVNLVAVYADFFQRQPTYLAPTLNFMFSCLESPALMHTSAKTIFALCDACRKTLGEYAMSFASQYHSFVTSGERDADVKEKLTGAMAAVVQGSSTRSSPQGNVNQPETLEVLNKLLDPIETDINKAIAASLNSSLEYARDRGLCAVLCLASMGKALRAPDPTIILLEADGPLEPQPLSQNGIETQRRIVDLYSKVLEMFPADGEIMEAVCNIFRAGFTESSGPFVLPLEALETLLHTYSHITSRSGYLLETITRVLSKNGSRSKSDSMQGFSLRCLHRGLHLVGWIQGSSSTNR